MVLEGFEVWSAQWLTSTSYYDDKRQDCRLQGNKGYFYSYRYYSFLL